LHPYSCFLVAISHEHQCSKILLLGPYIGSSSNHPPPFSTCVSFSVGGGGGGLARLTVTLKICQKIHGRKMSVDPFCSFQNWTGVQRESES
jgi:hypothetical protein